MVWTRQEESWEYLDQKNVLLLLQQDTPVQTGFTTRLEYDLKVWECDKITTSTRFQNKVLRSVVNSSKYVQITDRYHWETCRYPQESAKSQINEETSRFKMSKFTFKPNRSIWHLKQLIVTMEELQSPGNDTHNFNTFFYSESISLLFKMFWTHFNR